MSAEEAVGEWLSLVEHLVRDQGVGGSNPLSPTIVFNNLRDIPPTFGGPDGLFTQNRGTETSFRRANRRCEG